MLSPDNYASVNVKTRHLSANRDTSVTQGAMTTFFPAFYLKHCCQIPGYNKKKSSHSSLSLEVLCLRKNLWFCYSYTELKILFRKQMFLNSQPFNVYGFSFKRSALTVTSLHVLNSCCWIIILYDLLIFYWLSLANPFLVWAAKRKLKISNFPIVTDDIHNSLVAPLQLISFYDNRQQILLAWHF